MKKYSMLERDFLKKEINAQTDSKSITPEHVVSLSAAISKSQFKESNVWTKTESKVFSKGVVGIIQSEDCSLEILPKIYLTDRTDNENEVNLRNSLVHMISVVENFGIISPSSLGSQSYTIMELLIEIFLNKLNKLVRLKMPQEYVQSEDDLPRLRGSLDIVRQFTVNVANPTRLACRFDQLSKNIELNKIMKATITFLAKISKSQNNQKKIRILSYEYSDIDSVPINQLKWESVSFDHTNIEWKETYVLAKLFLNKIFQNVSSGKIMGYSMLFEIHRLFEDYIAKIISILLENENQIVIPKKLDKHCVIEMNGGGRIQTQPDIVIMSKNASDEWMVKQIFDTKWKKILDFRDDVWRGVESRDVYQIMAYSELYDSPRMTLFYPHSLKDSIDVLDIEKIGKKLIEEGLQSYGKINVPNDRYIEIFTFDVMKGEMNLSKIIDRLDKLLNHPLPP